MKVICQKWEESEAGWGTRPDGYSLHLTEADRAAFVEGIYKDRTGPAPHEYERLDGTPYECEIADSDERITRLLRSKHGIRVSNNNYPPGGKDGWLPVSLDKKE